MRTRLSFVAAIIGVAFAASCTVHQTGVPNVAGPSGLAHAVTITLSPTTISRDGVSTSQVKVFVNGPNGPESQTIRLEMLVDGQPNDVLGTLSARTITSASNGVATATFTVAPPSVPPTPTIDTVSIQAFLTGSDSQSSAPASADIRLMPLGVILPAGDPPTAVFTMSPPPVTMNVSSTFDGSTSCPGAADANGNCIVSGVSSQAITSFLWNFGDGGTASGPVVTHAFATPGTFTVTLTVTNDRGVKASKTQVVTIAASTSALGDWVFSPTGASAPANIIFNADGVHAAPGHNIVQYSWNFGDPFSTLAGNTGSTSVVNHLYTGAGTFTVTLTVVDDTGAKTVITHQVAIK
jgi:chitodextrinase